MPVFLPTWIAVMYALVVQDQQVDRQQLMDSMSPTSSPSICTSTCMAVKYHDVFPVGFRFRPDETEVLKYYLFNKVFGHPLPYDDGFKDANIYLHDPDDLPIDISDGYTRWGFFFCPQNETRRTPNGGEWRCVTGDTEIVEKDGDVIGFKRSFVFQRRGIGKTKWRMDEYRLNPEFYGLDKMVKTDHCAACEIYKKEDDCDEKPQTSE